MNLLAAATQQQQQTPYQNQPYQAQNYQNTTIQPDRPVAKPSFKAKVFVYGNLIFNYIVIILIVVLIFRFIKAFEKIASSLAKGIVIRKDDNPTT